MCQDRKRLRGCSAKTSPPRRLTTLRSKSEELQFPNGIRPANTETLLLLLEALGAGAVEAAKGWVESKDSGTIYIGNEALQMFLAREGAGELTSSCPSRSSSRRGSRSLSPRGELVRSNCSQWHMVNTARILMF